ncbi:MAG: phosphoribosyltransferase family protein [Candidatus Dependentiae bacterium]|nr:phosphoribosyltransferase family protein [Candidatus Dependentiae bacterium]
MNIHLAKFSSFIYAIPNVLIDLLSPPICAHCKDFVPQRVVFCDSCAIKLEPVVTIMLPITATISVKLCAAAAYKEPIKTLIMAKHWSDEVASYQLGQLIWERTDVKTVACDYIIPIPLHWTRFAKRGFNQAEEIAQMLSKNNGKRVVNILSRVKKTSFQAGLKSADRIANVHEAFALKGHDKSLYKDKHLMLVDDLCTTGSTVRAAAKVLLSLKPSSITVVVASRVID